MSEPTASAAGAAMPAEGDDPPRRASLPCAIHRAQASALAVLPVAALAAPHGEDAEIPHSAPRSSEDQE